MHTSAAIREPAEPTSAAPAAEAAPASAPDVAFDAARAYLGANASYYDETWRVMGWRGSRVAWNGAAALFGPFWLAYRRMPALAAAYILWLGLLFDLYQGGTPPVLLGILQASLMLATGLFANLVYLRRFSHACRRLTDRSLDPLAAERRLIAKGGTSRLAVVVTGLALAALITALATL